MESDGTPKRNDLETVTQQAKSRSHIDFWTRFYRSPLWLGLFILLAVYVLGAVQTDPDYTKAWNYVRGDHVSYFADWLACLGKDPCSTRLDGNKLTLNGVTLTVYLAVTSYALAIVIGLLVGIVRSAKPTRPNAGSKPRKWFSSIMHLIFHNLLTFYVEFMRGVPSLVFILVAGFIIMPSLKDTINTQFVPFLRTLFNNPAIPTWDVKALDPFTGIVALGLIYGAYLSEVFRAGIQGIPKGQVEASRSLGMTYLQTMRFVVVPQAIRAVIPPLGNDFIAIIKDTSLLTILGVNEVTQLAKKWSGSQFTYLETYLVLTFVYLVMTVSGSLLVQYVERYLKRHEGH